jgi:phosphomannomutase
LNDAEVPDGTAVPRDEAHAATERYFTRCAGVLPAGALAGLRVGVFEHSTVAHDLLMRVLGHYGAEVVALGRTDSFVAVDTEAFGDAVFAPLRGWIESERLDLIVSADGDGDRPLIMDGAGNFVRGDVLGLLTAQFLGATTVVTPVTSNSAIERLGVFDRVVRTKVGSPFVVAAMETATGSVVGFEANGGTFIGGGVEGLDPLPTRDAILPMLCVLGLAQREGKALSELVGALPLLHAVADRLQHVPGEKSAAFLGRLETDRAFASDFFGGHGVKELSAIDGLKFTTAAGDSVHFRASGNAPELRCYVEASTPQKANDLLAWAMEAAAQQVT